MADNIVGGLFGMMPEDVAAQRMAALDQQAQAFGRMSSDEAYKTLGYKAGNLLGQGLFGVNDPQMERARQRQQMTQGIDFNDPESLMQAARRANEMGDSEAAQGLATQAFNIKAKIASIAKDTAAAGRERQQAVPVDIQKAQRISLLKSVISKAKQEGNEVEIQPLQDELDALTAVPSGSRSDLGTLLFERDLLDPVKDAGKIKIYNKKIEKLSSGGGLADDIAAGLSPLAAALATERSKKAGGAEGTDVGKDTAAIQGKYAALTSIQDALSLLKQGIYSGAYGKALEQTAKYSLGGVGDKQRLINTESFRAAIGEVVIPRLVEFGGNDSVEELKFLERVSAGDTQLEQKTIQRILESAYKKISSGIKRIQDQQSAISKGQPLPTGPVDVQPTVPTAKPSVKRWNRSLNNGAGGFEPIGG